MGIYLFCTFILLFFCFRKARAQKLSNASEKQRQKINEMLNASQNSQAERDYLRQKILEIFQEDENALKEHEENSYNNNKIDRKRGYSLPNNDGRKSDSISSKNGHNIDLVDNTKVDRKSTESGFESGSAGMGSERLGSRSSVQFIDVPSDEKVRYKFIFGQKNYFLKVHVQEKKN